MYDVPGVFNRYSKAKLHLSRVRLNSQGYESDGSYWGVDGPLYHAMTINGDHVRHIRASDRENAKAQLVTLYPNVTFFR